MRTLGFALLASLALANCSNASSEPQSLIARAAQASAPDGKITPYRSSSIVIGSPV